MIENSATIFLLLLENMTKFANFNLTSLSSGAAFAVPQSVDADAMESILGIKQRLHEVDKKSELIENPKKYLKDYKDALKLVADAAANAYNKARKAFEAAYGPEEAHQRAIGIARSAAEIAIIEMEVNFPGIDSSTILKQLGLNYSGSAKKI